MKSKPFRQRIKQFTREEDGLGTLEVLLIIAALVAIAIVFREWIISWVNKLFEQTQDGINDSNIGQLNRPADESGGSGS